MTIPTPTAADPTPAAVLSPAPPVTGSAVRVRFCPSPTGTPHVGMARTALFNWAFARRTGGTFVFRVEDTDAGRDTQQSFEQLLHAMHWLGLDYDEGPDIGGPYGPYRQSERRPLHLDVAARLLAAGYAYESYSSNEEVEARHRAAGRDPKLGYDNVDRDLTEEQRSAYRASGREPVLRLRMPDADITFTDLIRGEVTFRAGSVPDFVLVRAGGQPLYTLVNPVDDATMGITHVVRGEDLLSSTPRQIALYAALVKIGVAERVPTFAHLPLVLGEGNRKLSKRDPQSNLFLHRDRGFIREGMINYLALLGWSIADDHDLFSPAELTGAFDVRDVNPNPARWDQKKAEAINAEHIRRLEPADFAGRLVPYLQRDGVLSADPGADELDRLGQIAPLVQTRVQVLSEATAMVAPFYLSDDELPVAEDARAQLGEQAGPVLSAAAEALGQVEVWKAAELEGALRTALVDGLGLKARLAFGPVRTAISGQRISPPLFESMEILGRGSSLARLARLQQSLTEATG
ncbi:MAG TPA: glutamate--tRNA ligase [Propionibacteriaceae bacterium]|nr:glutamate--tRNA ligase [Propionibacteriaceae bacterium]